MRRTENRGIDLRPSVARAWLLMTVPRFEDLNAAPSASLQGLKSDGLLALLAETFDAILLIEPETGQIRYANRSAERLFTHRGGSLAGQSIADHLIFDPPIEGAAPLARDRVHRASHPAKHLGIQEGHLDARVCNLVIDGQSLTALVLRPSLASDEECDGFDLPAARRDPLTGLADRAFALDRLETLLASPLDERPPFALLFIDLDNFKTVNDAWGHLAGDEVLKEVALRLKRSVRATDHVARFGGDEFVVIAEGPTSRADVEPVISRIRSALAAPIQHRSGESRLTVSIGVALSTDEQPAADSLLMAADRDMYQAKRSMH